MKLNQLEQVVAICREGSFSGAARALHIAQPTLSKSISRLEGELGVSLFSRDGTGARPTAAASFIAERGEDVLRSVRLLDADLRRLVQGERGTIRIGVGPASRLKPLPQMMALVAETFPRLHVEVRQESGAAIARGLAEERYDIVFTFAENAEPYGDLIRVKLFEDRIVAAVRPGHALLSGVRHPFEAVRAFPMASFRTATAVDPILGSHDDNRSAFLSDDPDMIRERARRSDFVAYVPRFVVEEDLAAERLVEVPLRRNAVFDCWMLATPRGWNMPVVRRIAELARAQFT